jgi:hypothetical protein
MTRRVSWKFLGFSFHQVIAILAWGGNKIQSEWKQSDILLEMLIFLKIL